MLTSENGRPAVDASHQGAIVLIFVPTFLCPAILLICASMIVRKRTVVSITWSWTSPVLWDFIGHAAMLTLTIPWSIVTCLETQVGLGTAERPQDVRTFEKVLLKIMEGIAGRPRVFEKLMIDQYEYASELLYLLAIMSWKASNGLSSAQIFGLADERRRRHSTITTGAIAVIFVATFFACAFQCRGPNFSAIRSQPESSCFNRPAFWASVGGIDILSDLFIHGLLLFTIFRSQMVSTQKRAAMTIVALYLTAYVATAGTRLAFISRSWNDPHYALIAAWTALSTFSQLIFPISVLCLGKLSRFLDLESYLSPAIGAASRKVGSKTSQNYYLPHNYGRNRTNVSGPALSKKRYTDSVEELPLRDRSRSSGHGGNEELDIELSDSITVRRDVEVRSENGNVND